MSLLPGSMSKPAIGIVIRTGMRIARDIDEWKYCNKEKQYSTCYEYVFSHLGCADGHGDVPLSWLGILAGVGHSLLVGYYYLGEIMILTSDSL